MSDTPIYDRLMKEHSKPLQLMALDKEYFQFQAEEHPVSSFDIEVEDFQKMSTSLLGLLYATLSEMQENVHMHYNDSANIFNRGFEAAIESVQNIFIHTVFEEN